MALHKQINIRQNLNKISKPLILTLDTNIQYFIKEELKNALRDFQAKSGGALLMDIHYPKYPNGIALIHISGSG